MVCNPWQASTGEVNLWIFILGWFFVHVSIFHTLFASFIHWFTLDLLFSFDFYVVFFLTKYLGGWSVRHRKSLSTLKRFRIYRYENNKINTTVNPIITILLSPFSTLLNKEWYWPSNPRSSPTTKFKIKSQDVLSLPKRLIGPELSRFKLKFKDKRTFTLWRFF